MNKFLKFLSTIPLSIVLPVALVIFVFFFANPKALLSDLWTGATKEEIRGNESTIVTDVKPVGKLKVLKRFVGGFLELPEDTPENKEERENTRVIYQWEGSAEFTIDLAKVVRDTSAEDNSMVLHMPKIEIENPRTLPIAGTRCVIKRGRKADAILGSINDMIGKKIRMEVETPENIKLAREQAEYLLRSMISATSSDVKIKFDWSN